MKKKGLIVFIIGIFLVNYVTAADHYVRQGASGSGTGEDWTNAYTSLPSNLVRGDTYYIADGSYGSYIFDDPESGTEYITIKKATASDYGTDTGWQSTYGDDQAIWSYNIAFFSNYWVFDGITGYGKDAASYGFKILHPSSCGTTESEVRLGNYGNSVPGFYYSRLSHVEIEGCGSAYDVSQVAIDGRSRNGARPMNITISHNYIHNIGHMLKTMNWQDGLVEYNYFEDDWSSSSNHGEAFSSDGDDNMIYRYNVFEDACTGSGCIMCIRSLSNFYVYGNVFVGTSPGGNGPVGCGSRYSCTNFKIYNNVFANFDKIPFVSVKGEIYNNIFYNISRNINLPGSHNYNWFSGADVIGESDGIAGENSDPFADWQNGDFRLKVATEPGLTLPFPYNTDPDGNTRGSDGVWDIGAYEYVSGAGPVCGDGTCEIGETPAGCPADCKTTSTCGPADENSDGVVSTGELTTYISEWKLGNVTISDLITPISEWKNGC